MKCPRCEHDNPDIAKFCLECGSRFALTCSKCRSELPPSAKFCLECGERVDGAASDPSRFANPKAYTPKHLAERVLTSKAALEGERKRVTVLFADLKGSMELLADRDPEEARKILDPVLERMMEAVHRYEGTINQVMGDGIMALFGAPLAHEDHALRACYAALRMQESIRRYADEVHRTTGIPLHIRLGINSGEVVVRSIGSDLHMDYTAVGQTTHLAARLEQMAMPGSILISPDTLKLVEGYVLVKALGERPAKGLPAPIQIFEIAGAGTARSRLQAAAARGLTRFVGRDLELEQLRLALERASIARGQIVAIVGEPGVGKSRIFWEFTHSHRTQGWQIVESISVSYGSAASFLPLIELLRSYFLIETHDDARKIREKVTGKLLSLDRALEPSLPALLWLLDTPVDDPQWQRLDPPQRRQQTLDGIKRLLLRESQVQPLLLVFEDLHWIDAETQAFLDIMVEGLPTARILLLVNYRPEYEHGWASRTYYRQLRLDPLPPESADELLDDLLGEDVGLESLKRLLIERTEGNPFFLEESVRTLVETQAMSGERGAYRLAKPSQTLQIPATAQAILAARIDRLEPEDKRLLQAASVIGKDVPLALLQAIAEGPEDTIRRGLGNLQAAEFIYEAQIFPDLEYTFRHALTHEVAYGSVLQERRRDLHARIVAVVERLHAGRIDEQVDRLAHHALQGELWDKAFRYCRIAGAKAVGRSAYREALTMLECAQSALGHLPDQREIRESRIDLLLEFQPVFNALGDLDRMLRLLGEAESLAEPLDDQHRLTRVLAYSGRCFWWMGLPSRSVTAGERALAIAAALRDASLEVVANYHLGHAHVLAGDFTKAIEVFGRSEAILTSPLEEERFGMPALPSVIARVWRGVSQGYLGEFDEGVAAAKEAVRIAEAAGHAYSIAIAVEGVGFIETIRGNFVGAVPWLQRARELAVSGFAVLLSLSLSFLGRALTLLGRADARSVLEEAVQYSTSIRFMVFRATDLAWLAYIHLSEGRRDEAMTTIERALDLARTHGQRAHEAEAMLILGTIKASSNSADVEEVRDCFCRTLSLAEELGMRPLVAHCHLGLSKLHQQAGDGVKANEHLDIATAMSRAMGMSFWF